MIAVGISREYKSDQINRSWWTGKWWGSGLGASAWTQPVREIVVKVRSASFASFPVSALTQARAQLTEMSLFAGDFLTGHILLFALAIPCLIPGFAQLHSIALLWLKPSRQIRAPLYSIKQARQRKSIIARCVRSSVRAVATESDSALLFRYGILFLLAAVVFAALIVVRPVLKTYSASLPC